jgi:hypothetical protein
MGQCVSELNEEQIIEIKRIAKTENLKRLADTLEKVEVKESKLSIMDKPIERPIERPNTLKWKKNVDNSIDIFHKDGIFKVSKETDVFCINYSESLENFLMEFNDEIKYLVEIVKNNLNEIHYESFSIFARHFTGGFCGFILNTFKHINYSIDNEEKILHYMYKLPNVPNHRIFFYHRSDVIYVDLPDNRYLEGIIEVQLDRRKIIMKDVLKKYWTFEFPFSIYCKNAFNDFGYKKMNIPDEKKFISLEDWNSNKPVEFQLTIGDDDPLVLKSKLTLVFSNYTKSTTIKLPSIPVAFPIIMPPPIAPVESMESMERLERPVEIPIEIPNISELPEIPGLIREPHGEPQGEPIDKPKDETMEAILC